MTQFSMIVRIARRSNVARCVQAIFVVLQLESTVPPLELPNQMYGGVRARSHVRAAMLLPGRRAMKMAFSLGCY
jgi:hypothetical protein